LPPAPGICIGIAQPLKITVASRLWQNGASRDKLDMRVDVICRRLLLKHIRSAARDKAGVGA
jgi:hypothetical protein